MEGYYVVSQRYEQDTADHFDSLKTAHTVMIQSLKDKPEEDVQVWYCVPVANGPVRCYPCGTPK
jgi:hypothetical protein